MGAGVKAALDVIEAVNPSDAYGPIDWALVEHRVRRYLRALGVRSGEEFAVLVPQVLKRVEFRAALGQIGEPLEAAIEETHLLLDQWLVTELGLDGDADALSAARAAVLGGDVAGWTARWAGLSSTSLALEIRAGRVASVPPLAPLEMAPSSIQLCCHRTFLRLLARLGRLLRLRGRRTEPVV